MSGPPVVGERWTCERELPPGTPEQVRAWLEAARVPRMVVIVGGEQGDVWYSWLRLASGVCYVPMRQVPGKARLEYVNVPGPGTTWEPHRDSPTFRMELGEFTAAFTRLP